MTKSHAGTAALRPRPVRAKPADGVAIAPQAQSCVFDRWRVMVAELDGRREPTREPQRPGPTVRPNLDEGPPAWAVVDAEAAAMPSR